MNDLSEFVREKRKSFGMTQPELAEKAGTGLRFIRD
ncbi:MAG: transcriptional regulator, partial [Chlorobium sp.]